MLGLWMLTGCARPSAVSNRTVEVDRLEGEVATVVDRATGEVLDVPRRSLPPGAAEGNVVVDGRLDAAMSAQLRAEVKDARGALRRSRSRSLDEDAAERDPGADAVTASDGAQ